MAQKTGLIVLGLAAAGLGVFLLARPVIAVPNISLQSLTWDATPPFDTNSRHVWMVRMKNLSIGRLTYRLEMYMNGKHFMGYTANLATGEVRKISQPYHFGTEGSYTLNIRAYYGDELLDEISSTVYVEVPPAPDVINGTLLISYFWWEGLPGWRQISPINAWPANTAIETQWKPRNTGNVTATFKVTFMGQSGSITLSPGESDWVEFTVNTVGLGSYRYTMNIYGDGKLVESRSLGVTTY